MSGRHPRQMLRRAAGIAAMAVVAAWQPAEAAASAPQEVSAAGAATASVAASRGHRSRRHHRTRHYPRVSWGWSIGWGPYWGPSWGPYWGGYWYPAHSGYPVVYPRRGQLYGALDTDVRPERAEIWVDGRRVGVADEFDGFPDYLWLEKGTYDVVIYLPGFQTIARQYTVYPGLVLDVEDRMERGESIHPRDLATSSHERRDERLRRDREQLERSREAGLRRRGDADWLDARVEPGRLLLQVLPPDASVYLDGRFVGTGDDLARLHSGLLVDGGTHRLEVVRPGFVSETRAVEIEVGDEFAIDVELAAEEVGPR